MKTTREQTIIKYVQSGNVHGNVSIVVAFPSATSARPSAKTSGNNPSIPNVPKGLAQTANHISLGIIAKTPHLYTFDG